MTMDTSKPKNIGLLNFFDFVSRTATTSIEDGPAGVSFCHICEEYILSANDEEHYQSQCHQRSWNEFCSRIENILEIRDDAVNTTRTIPQVHWQNRIYESIGRAVATDDKTLMERAKQLRSWYKHLECISLLELALWKFCCVPLQQQQKQSRKHDNHEHNIGLKSLLEWKLWEKSGWKVYKKLHFRCNEVVIHMNAILPFLPYQEQHQGDTYELP